MLLPEYSTAGALIFVESMDTWLHTHRDISTKGDVLLVPGGKLAVGSGCCSLAGDICEVWHESNHWRLLGRQSSHLRQLNVLADLFPVARVSTSVDPHAVVAFQQTLRIEGGSSSASTGPASEASRDVVLPDTQFSADEAGHAEQPPLATIDGLQSLLGDTPESFNQVFERMLRTSPQRARVVTRDVVADMIEFPEGVIRQTLPEIHRLTSQLAAKAGCPFS